MAGTGRRLMNRPSALSFIGLLCACQGSRTGDLGIDLVLSAHDDNTLSAEATVTLDEEGSVHLEFWNDQVDPLRTLESAADTHHTLDVVGMRADSSYTLQAVATLADGTELRGETTTFSTGSLPVELPPLEVVTGQGESAAMTLLGPAMDRADGDYESTDFAFLTGVDREGEVVWYYEGDDLDLGPNHAGELLADGSLQILGKSQVLGVSPAGETLWSIDTELAGTVHHDAATLSNGNVVVMTQEVQTHQVEDLGGEVPLIGDVLHELDNDGEVVWSWSTFDHLDVERFRQRADEGARMLAMQMAGQPFQQETDGAFELAWFPVLSAETPPRPLGIDMQGLCASLHRRLVNTNQVQVHLLLPQQSSSLAPLPEGAWAPGHSGCSRPGDDGRTVVLQGRP